MSNMSLAQSKWGRHCCRPHSHRRVVFRPVHIRRCFPFGSAWRPVSFRVPEGPRSVTGARAGIRFFRRILLLPVAEASFRRHRTPSVSPRPVNPWMVDLSSSVRPKPNFPFDPDRIFRSWLRTYVAWSSSSLASGRSLLQSTLAGRVDSRSHIDLFQKSQVFQSVRMRNSKSSSRFDDLRLRFESVLRKQAAFDFSTSKRIRCGGQWITQRIVDSVQILRASEALKRMCYAAARLVINVTTHRSRLPRSLSRKAFKRINPSASLWSYAPASSSNVTCASE